MSTEKSAKSPITPSMIVGYASLFVSLSFAVITGVNAYNVTPHSAKTVEELAAVIHEHDRLVLTFITGTIFSGLIGSIAFAIDFHVRVRSLDETNNRVTTVLSSIEAWVHLKPFRGIFHHYHLTKNRDGHATWIYKTLRFHGDQASGRLFASAPVRLSTNDDPKQNMYHFEASVSGLHLVIRTQRFDDPSDVAVDIYPYAGSHKRPLYSGRVNMAWNDTLITSISVLSDQPLRKADGTLPEDGLPVDNHIAAQLLRDWERHSNIGHLPSSAELGVSVLHRSWNDDKFFIEMIEKSPLNAEIKILTSFFTNHPDLFHTLNAVLRDSQRRVTILMASPDPNNVALDIRYGTGGQSHRADSITAATARAEINTQLAELAHTQQELERLAKEADKANKPKPGTLNVLVYKLAPTLVSYQIHDEMLAGFLFTHRSANAGPMLRINKSEPLWDVIEENWNTVFRFSKVPEQKESATNAS